MSTLTRQCEEFLLGDTPSVRSLVLGERHQLIKLKPKCLQHIKLNMQAKKFKIDPDYNNLTTEAQNEVLMDKAMNYESVMDEVQQILNSAIHDRATQHCTDHNKFQYSCWRCHNKVYSSASDKINVVKNGVLQK